MISYKNGLQLTNDFEIIDFYIYSLYLCNFLSVDHNEIGDEGAKALKEGLKLN